MTISNICGWSKSDSEVRGNFDSLLISLIFRARVGWLAIGLGKFPVGRQGFN